MDEKQRERIYYDGDLVHFHRERSYLKTDHYALHCHSAYEVYYFIDGRVSYLVEGRKYMPRPHSLLLMAPNVFHGVKIESDQGYERMSVHLNVQALQAENAPLLLSPFRPLNNASDIYYENAEQFHIIKYLEDLCSCIGMDADMLDMALRLRTQNLLLQILKMSRQVKGIPAAYDNAAVKQMIVYLNEHLTDEINLEALSKRFYISKYYLNTLFKKATGTTVMNYVIHKRITLARQLMVQGNTPARASESAGFRDYSSFFRAYKKIYGKAPSES